MKQPEEENMTIQNSALTKQDEQSATPPRDLKQQVMEIRQERNRLLRSVVQQPTDVLRDIAILAIGWAAHELEVAVAEHHHAPFDFVSWVYGYRIFGLGVGEYGTGMMARMTDDGPQMFDTSTCTLVGQLRKYAENEAEK